MEAGLAGMGCFSRDWTVGHGEEGTGQSATLPTSRGGTSCRRDSSRWACLPGVCTSARDTPSPRPHLPRRGSGNGRAPNPVGQLLPVKPRDSRPPGSGRCGSVGRMSAHAPKEEGSQVRLLVKGTHLGPTSLPLPLKTIPGKLSPRPGPGGRRWEGAGCSRKGALRVTQAPGPQDGEKSLSWFKPKKYINKGRGRIASGEDLENN